MGPQATLDYLAGSEVGDTGFARAGRGAVSVSLRAASADGLVIAEAWISRDA